MSNKENNTYLIAGSIIIAGLLIAVGVFMSGDRPDVDNGDDPLASEDFNISEVTTDDYIKGELGAAVTIVEYSDTECPFCQRFHATLDQVVETYPGDEVAWVYRHFPLASIHPKAPREAHAAECAAELGGNEGFWTFIDRLYEITPSNNGLDLSTLPDIAEFAGLDREAFEECQSENRHIDAVEADFNDAVSSGGTGTPYNVFVVQEELSDNSLSGLSILEEQFGEGSIRVSDDRTKVAIGGALSFEGVQQVIEILLDRVEIEEATES